MSKVIPFLAFVLLSITACKKDCPEPTYANSTEVNLAHPRPGQSSHFVSFSKICDGEFGQYTFVGDTLVLTVIEEEDQLFFHEQFTPNSPSAGIEGVTYPVVKSGDYLKLSETHVSRLFYFYGNGQIYFNPEVDHNLAFDGCFVFGLDGPFTGDAIGHIPLLEYGPLKKQGLILASGVPLTDIVDVGFIGYKNNTLELSHSLVTIGIAGPVVTGWIRIN